MTGPRLGRRGLVALEDLLTARDRLILHQVADLRLMTAGQIEAVHFTLADHATKLTAARSSRRVLERLARDRLLVRLDRRIGGVRAGSASYIYAIGPVGQRIVETHRFAKKQATDLDDREPRRRFREPSSSFVLHTLAISELVMELIVGSSGGDFDLLELEPEPTCWRTIAASTSTPPQLRPDLFLSIGVGEYEYRWFVEVDLGTEHLTALLRKCAVYESYFHTGQEQERHGVFPRVLWSMNSERRVVRLQAAITRSPTLTTALFTVTTADEWRRVIGSSPDGAGQ